MEELASEGPAGGLGARTRPVDAGHARAVVPSEGVFAGEGFDVDACVEEGAAEVPECGGECAWWEEVVDVY